MEVCGERGELECVLCQQYAARQGYASCVRREVRYVIRKERKVLASRGDTTRLRDRMGCAFCVKTVWPLRPQLFGKSFQGHEAMGATDEWVDEEVPPSKFGDYGR